jgi:hypothetical protein
VSKTNNPFGDWVVLALDASLALSPGYNFCGASTTYAQDFAVDMPKVCLLTSNAPNEGGRWQRSRQHVRVMPKPIAV